MSTVHTPQEMSMEGPLLFATRNTVSETLVHKRKGGPFRDKNSGVEILTASHNFVLLPLEVFKHL
jgi:hypothetical protein